MILAFQEFIPDKVFCEHVSGILICRYEEQMDFPLLSHFPNVVVAYVHVFGAFLSYCIGGNKDCPLVVTA